MTLRENWGLDDTVMPVDFNNICKQINQNTGNLNGLSKEFITRKIMMSAAGFDKKNDDYLAIQSYSKNSNPQNYPYSYVDIGYRCNMYKNSDGSGDVSNIKIYGDGEMRLAPIKKSVFTTNFVNGAYAGEAERIIAELGSSSSEYYDLHMNIRAIVNSLTTNGLILGHYNADNISCFVRVNTDSNGDRFFRALTNEGNVANGSTGYPWKSVHSKVTYSSDNVLFNKEKSIKTRLRSSEDIIDNIDFINPRSSSGSVQMDITRIQDTDYVDIDGDNAYINESQFIKLALKEIKELKDKLKILEGKIV